VKVFIDSDSDVRLSRRVFQDTQENKKDLNESVANYLEFIKPSYEREIEPTKQTSDIIIPHFGGGFNDHKKECKSIPTQISRSSTPTSRTPADSSSPTSRRR
jgi:uridine kinase